MANTDFKSIDEYIKSRPEAVQGVLKKVRRVIRKAIPTADETISYQIPAFKLNGRVVVYFAGWKKHYSIYPSTAGVVAAFKKDLAGYEMSKGTIRFPLSERVPATLIAGIAKLRAKEAADAERAKTAARKSHSRTRV